ncbi:MAG: methylated-DNA--[protein]-cysteine S-methyltransferase [Thermodesulfovibrionia bacterium]
MKGICYDIFECPIGTLYLVSSGGYLVGLLFKKPMDIPFKPASAPEGFIRELSEYFQGTNVSFNQGFRLLKGTDFEKRVWLSLMDIPYGETRTYKWLAEKIGMPKAARAVGRALAKNPFPIILPCHRVIESDGSIGGYSSGIDIKRRLLELEYYSSKR